VTATQLATAVAFARRLAEADRAGGRPEARPAIDVVDDAREFAGLPPALDYEEGGDHDDMILAAYDAAFTG
jgi:hypothetical protein